MSSFYTGKIKCKYCREEVSWYCVGKHRRWEDNPPSDHIQMTHSYDFFGKKEMFSGYCGCGRFIRLPDEVVGQIPEEYFIDMP